MIKLKTNVRKFGASEGSQKMCLEPIVAAVNEVRMIADDYIRSDAQQLIDDLAKKREMPTPGNRMYLDKNLPNWQEILRFPKYMLD